MEISRKTKYKLLEKYSEKEIFKFTKEELEKEILEEKYINEILKDSKRKNLDKIYEFMIKNNICVIKYTDEKYPQILKNIEDFPIYLMIRGNIENLYSDNIAIVGTRIASSYGKNITRNLAYNLAEKNINIVSGLAIRNR